MLYFPCGLSLLASICLRICCFIFPCITTCRCAGVVFKDRTNLHLEFVSRRYNAKCRSWHILHNIYIYIYVSIHKYGTPPGTEQGLECFEAVPNADPLQGGCWGGSVANKYLRGTPCQSMRLVQVKIRINAPQHLCAQCTAESARRETCFPWSLSKPAEENVPKHFMHPPCMPPDSTLAG